MVDNGGVERFGANSPPYLTAQPEGLTVVQGGQATFGVDAGGTAPLAYQWRQNGTNIAGATASSYTRMNLAPSDAGNYSVLVTNAVGTVTSLNAVLTVTPLTPPLLTQPNWLADGRFQLFLTGDPGAYALYTSTNLFDWSFARFVTNTGATVEIVDDAATNYPQRFYRIAPAP